MPDFFERAWHSGADEYGRARAEKYGRRARWWALIKLAAIVVLVILIPVAISGGFGG
jgi:hypothetical protein